LKSSLGQIVQSDEVVIARHAVYGTYSKLMQSAEEILSYINRLSKLRGPDIGSHY